MNWAGSGVRGWTHGGPWSSGGKQYPGQVGGGTGGQTGGGSWTLPVFDLGRRVVTFKSWGRCIDPQPSQEKFPSSDN